jgi:hypothetical protein
LPWRPDSCRYTHYRDTPPLIGRRLQPRQLPLRAFLIACQRFATTPSSPQGLSVNVATRGAAFPVVYATSTRQQAMPPYSTVVMGSVR